MKNSRAHWWCRWWQQPCWPVAALPLASTANTGAAQAGTARSGGSSAGKPTIVLVHGAFADSSSWSSEIGYLQAKGYTVVAVANPLRGVAADSAYLLSVQQTIQGPIVLVGHPYANFPISAAAATDSQVKALVYVAAYIPDAGESPADLTYALEDHAIPTQAEIYMADRAHATIVTTHSGHDVPAARPGVVDSVILQAVRSVS